jgi:hypothetical protein
MKRLTLQILLLQLAVGLVPVYAATPFSPEKMALHEGKLSVQIVATSLPQVMAEISRLSGVKVCWLNGEDNEERVSVAFTNLSLAEALTRILAKKNFLLFYTSTADGARPLQLWITSRGGGSPAVTLPSPAAGKSLSRNEEEDSDEQDEFASVPLERLMQVAMEDQDSSVRERAIMFLEIQARTDPRAKGTLTHLAQYDPNPQVQSAAAEALQQLE